MTAPAAPPAPASTAPRLQNTCVAITLDVNDLPRACAFYAKALDFEPVAVDRPGLIYEVRSLRSPLCPNLELRLRAAFGKRATGGGPGSLLLLTIRVDDLPASLARLADVVPWVGSKPAAPYTQDRATFADPDGYQIQLVGLV